MVCGLTSKTVKLSIFWAFLVLSNIFINTDVVVEYFASLRSPQNIQLATSCLDSGIKENSNESECFGVSFSVGLTTSGDSKEDVSALDQVQTSTFFLSALNHLGFYADFGFSYLHSSKPSRAPPLV